VWELIVPMTTVRSLHGAAALDDKLYVLGGTHDSFRESWYSLRTVERYDPTTDIWEEMPPMMKARSQFGVAVLDGKLYAAGGLLHRSRVLGSVERFDPVTNTWEEVAPMSAPRFAHSAAVVNGKLYVAGGKQVAGPGVDSYLASVERYDPSTNTWEDVAPLQIGRSHLCLTAGCIDLASGSSSGF